MSLRVVNVTNGHRYKFNQAKRLVEQQCACAWVQYGVSVRELTVDEMVKARSEQFRMRELTEGVMSSGNVFNTRFVPPPNTTYQAPRRTYEEQESPLLVRVCAWPRRHATQAELAA